MVVMTVAGSHGVRDPFSASHYTFDEQYGWSQAPAKMALNCSPAAPSSCSGARLRLGRR